MSANVSAQLSILIGAPHSNQSSIHHDLAAMYRALKRRGLTSEEILCLEGKIDRRLLLGFLEAIHHRIADWEQGALFLYVTGHGFFSSESAQDAHVGVVLPPTKRVGDEYHVFWDELFQALSVPQGVTLALLPDH
jgi:hypothetical protein